MTVTQDGALTWTIGGVTYEVKARRGNNFDPNQLRDRKGRWIETGASVSIWGGGKGTVERNLGGGYLEVRTPEKRKLRVHRNYLTVEARADGSKPTDTSSASKPAPLKVEKPSAGVEDFTPAGDGRVRVAELKPGQPVLVYGTDQSGEATSAVGWVRAVDADAGGHTVTLDVGGGATRQVGTDPDAVARPIPEEPLARLVQAERDGDPNAASIAAGVVAAIRDADDAEANTPAAGVGGRGDQQPNAAPGSPITAKTSRPRHENRWGMFADAKAPVSYHDDGEIGQAVKSLGEDAQLDVDGESLINTLEVLATDAVMGRRSSQEVLDQIKTLRDRLPEGTRARRALDSAVAALDAPDTPPPTLPDGTPEPLRQLAADLHAVPLIRRDPDQEMAGLLSIVDAWEQGNTTPRRIATDVAKLGNRRHESLEGKAEIDRAVARAGKALEELRTRDRRAFDPPSSKPAAEHEAPEVDAPAPQARPSTADAPRSRQPDVDAPEETPTPPPPPPAPVPAAPQAPASRGTLTAGDVRSGDRITFDVSVTAQNVERFSGGTNPPDVGDRVTVRGVLAADPEEDMFGGHTVRLAAEGARWETGRGIGPLGGGREFMLDDGHVVTKVGAGQERKPAPTPGPQARQDGLFLEPDRAGTAEMFDPYADDFETVGAEAPRQPDRPVSAPERSPREEAPAGGGTPEAVTPEVVQARVRDAYQALAKEPGDWVSLTQLRDRLGADLPREQVDAALRRMNRMPDVNLVPDDNQKMLTREDRAAALHIGEQDKHLISITSEPASAAKVDRTQTPPDSAPESSPRPTPQNLSDTELDAQVAQGQRRIDGARAAGARNRDDGDSALAEALAEPAVTERDRRTQRRASSAAAAKPEDEGGPVTPEVVQTRVRDAYTELAKKPGDWVNLRLLRDRLGDGMSREQVDEALRRMMRLPDVNLVGEGNQKILKPEDRAAAVHIGEQDRHLISILPAADAVAEVDLPDSSTATAQQLGDAFRGLGMPRTADAAVRARTLLDGDRREWTAEQRAEAVTAMRELHAAKFAEDARITDRAQARWARDVVDTQLPERAHAVGAGRLDERTVSVIDSYAGLEDEDLLGEIRYASPGSASYDHFVDELGRRGFDAQGQPLTGDGRGEESETPPRVVPDAAPVPDSPADPSPQDLSDTELDAQIAQGQRSVDAARAAGGRNRDDGDSELARALLEPLVAEWQARQQRVAQLDQEAASAERSGGLVDAEDLTPGDRIRVVRRSDDVRRVRGRFGRTMMAQDEGESWVGTVPEGYQPGQPVRLDDVVIEQAGTVQPRTMADPPAVRLDDQVERLDADTAAVSVREAAELRGQEQQRRADNAAQWDAAQRELLEGAGGAALVDAVAGFDAAAGGGSTREVEAAWLAADRALAEAIASAPASGFDRQRLSTLQAGLATRLVNAGGSIGSARRAGRLQGPDAPPVRGGDLVEGDRLPSTPDMPGGVVQEAVPAGDVNLLTLRTDEDARQVRAVPADQPVTLDETPVDELAPAAAPEGAPEPGVLAEVVPLPDGVAAGRVRLRTDQRKRLLDLHLDAEGSGVDEEVRQAAARLRARQDLSSTQMRALSDHLRGMAADDSQPGARRRSLARTASWVDAAEARLEGFPPPPHNPHRDAPEKAYARNLTMGDTIALPGGDGEVSYGTVTVVRPIRGFGLVAVHVRRDDGAVEQRVLPDGVDLWVMPDLPEDWPAPPRPDVREHIRADRLNVGDDIVIGSRRFGTPVTGTVVSVERTNRELSATEWYEVTVRGEDGSETTVPLGDRGWAAVVRTKRGPHSEGQAFAQAMPDETPEPVGHGDLRAGDRAQVEGVTGVVTTMSHRPGGATVTLLGDDGQQHTIPVFDDADSPPEITRLIAADDNAGARITQQLRYREQVTREREFTDFLAGVETRTSRAATSEVTRSMQDLPSDTSRDAALDAAETALSGLVRGDDAGAAAALARRLGAQDDLQQAELERLTQGITGAVAGRATSRLHTALQHVDRLPGESWPDAVTRLAAYYRDHPPTDRLALAGQSLAALRTRLGDADTSREQPPAGLPDGADLPARLAAYRAALPEDLANLGRQPVTRATFAPTTLAELETARVPEVHTATLWADDVADDDGPGEQAMAHLGAVRAAGRDVDTRFQHHLGGRETAINAELDGVTRRRGRAYTDLDGIDRDVVQQRTTGRDQAARDAGYDDFGAYSAAAPEEAAAAAAQVEQAIPAELIRRREAAVAQWQQHAAREAELRGMLATARRDALVATLAEIRPVGGDGITYTDRSGKPMTGRAGSNAAALKYVEQVLPSDWLAAARQLGPVEVVTGRGQHRHDPDNGRSRISLPADDDSAMALRDGEPVRVPVPSSQPGGVPKAGVAAHELGHRMEATIPGLVEAERLLHFDRTSSGPAGQRERGEPITGADGFEAYPGDFPNAYTGRVYRDGEAYEVFPAVLESLAGGRDSADDDLRQWGLGVLALLGTDPGGPSGGKTSPDKPSDPLDGIDVASLSDTRLRELLATVSDPDARARLRAELDSRNTPQTNDDEDLSSLSESELFDRVEKGWAGYGEDPAVTAAQNRLLAELEGRERDQKRSLGDLTESDLATMDTDDLAGLLTGNWHRYDNEQSVAAMLDQIMAELDGRDRARHADQGDPYAGIDLGAKSDDELEELRAQHEASYNSDPNSARLTKRIFAEMDDRDVARASAGEDQRSDTDRRIDDLIAQGWTPRDAYAEAHGLNPDEVERQERLALIDAERAPGERREDTLRRMHRQWVHEQWLAAEEATRGYLLNRAGVAANIDPKSLWGGNSSRAGKYASEELKRWWAEQPNGGRMTYAEWRAQWIGDQADRRNTRERRQSSSNGRDFGV
ncbi:hypothetical protein ABT352_32740 [Streptosporangium sp. NPDC000563]|uniref:hypothetical protein n=1 Tax=Streptosporangium sp. NPDC000563 TaxID=3154366 RepID=UPI003323C72B